MHEVEFCERGYKGTHCGGVTKIFLRFTTRLVNVGGIECDVGGAEESIIGLANYRLS